MKKSIYGLGFLITLTLSLNARLPIGNIISFFIQQTNFNAPDEPDKFNEMVATPGKVSSKIAKSIAAPSHRGIFVTYGGYLVVSDFNGQVTFPRMQQKPNLTLIVTESIEPVIMLGNTIHHWEHLNIPIATYSIEKKQDPQTEIYYWDVKQIPEPKKKIIPIPSIVIFAKPKNIIVPLGITVTDESQNLILPTLYSTKNINELEPSLAVLKVRQFFGPIIKTNKKENNTYYSTQISTQ